MLTVWPEVQRDPKSIAARIRSSERRLDRDHEVGHTCQLWSKRMIGAFQDAIDKDDFNQLVDVACKRARTEHMLIERANELEARKSVLLQRGQEYGQSREISQELDRIDRELREIIQSAEANE